MTQRSVGRRISRQHRWLRFLLRRRPCLYISIFEVLLVFVLSAALVGAVVGFVRLRANRLKIEAEDKKLEKLKNYITFAHCDYEDAPDFNELFCTDRSRKQAFAFRHHRLKEDNTDETCIDRHEQVDCHDTISEKDSILPEIDQMKNTVKQCAGLFDNKLKGSTAADAPDLIKAFSLTTEKLVTLQNEIVHASELIIQCPKCVLDAAAFRFSDDDPSCFQHVTTEAAGWPAFAADCDDLQSTGTMSCNVIGQ